jgi:branched-chain amino acid transport system permease protein
MAVLLAHNYLGRYLPEHVGRPLLLFLKTDDNRAFYYLCLAALALTWWAAAGLRRSRTGRVLIAMRDNERSAQAFGVNLVRTRLAAFGISGFMAAAAGALLAFHARAVSAGAFTPEQSVQIFLTAIIGGLGSIQGALLGAVYFAVVDFFVHGVVGQLLASSIGVLVVLYLLPGGLGALAYQGRDAVLRRVAIRRRIWVPSLFSDVAAAAGLTNRAPLAPRPQVATEPRQVPARYRQPSRIRTTGVSQSGPKWTYG